MNEEYNKEAKLLIYSLGWVVHNFNHLENELALCISLLIDPRKPQTGRTIIAGRPYSALVDLFSALILQRTKSNDSQSLEKNLNKIVKRLTNVNEKRNKVVHSRYLYGVQEKSFARSKLSIRIKKGVKVDEANISSAALYQLSKEIQILDFDLRKFTETEVVPIVLAPIWENKDDDIGTMWMIWSMQYKNLNGKIDNIYWQLKNR